jgi:hypothetical protein
MIDKVMKFFNEWKQSEPAFVFVGPPSSGKTVFFACAMDRLKRLLSDKPNGKWTLRTDDTETLKRHKSALTAMKNGKWPAKTDSPHKLYYELSRRFGFGEKIHLGTYNTRVLYHDYPGEVFAAAFDDESADEHWVNEIADLKYDIQSARGVFVVIDTPILHNGENEEYNIQLFNLLNFIVRQTKVKHIAVIFTKKDLFSRTPEFDPVSQIRNLYHDQWFILEARKAKYFFVSAVPNPIYDQDGDLKPPKKYETSMSEGLVEPLAWALGI